MAKKGVACPHCGGFDSAVKDTRSSNGIQRRRRECLGCGHRFTTHEVVATGRAVEKPLLDVQAALEKIKEDFKALGEAISKIDTSA